jgi:hypothetical protein
MQMKEHFLLLVRREDPCCKDREAKKGCHHGIRGCRNGKEAL